MSVTGGWWGKGSETEISQSAENAKKRGAYQLSGAPRKDGERSFSTKERPVVCTKDMQKAIFSEKGTF